MTLYFRLSGPSRRFPPYTPLRQLALPKLPLASPQPPARQWSTYSPRLVGRKPFSSVTHPLTTPRSRQRLLVYRTSTLPIPFLNLDNKFTRLGTTNLSTSSLNPSLTPKPTAKLNYKLSTMQRNTTQRNRTPPC